MRAVGHISTAVGLLIASVTVVTAIVRSFDEAFPVALNLAGAGGWVMVGAVVLASAFGSPAERWSKIWFGLAFVGGGIVSLWDDSPGAEYLGLGFALVGVGALGLHALVETKKRDVAAHQACPDCAETLKAKANVCRYCGYRLQDPPLRAFSP
jgi:hypothetical protein